MSNTTYKNSRLRFFDRTGSYVENTYNSILPLMPFLIGSHKKLFDVSFCNRPLVTCMTFVIFLKCGED